MRQKLSSLEALRGLAALVVLASHSLSGDLSPQGGYLAVDLFFVLSGFVIAHAYRDRMERGLTIGAFIKIRLIRLYPLYLAGSLITVLVILIFPHDPVMIARLGTGGKWPNPVDLLMNSGWAVLMLPSFTNIGPEYPRMLYPLNWAAWSLFFEMIANVVYALTWRVWTPKVLFGIMGCSAIGLIASACAGQPFHGGFDWGTLHLGLLRIFYSYAAGVLVFSLFKKTQHLPPATFLIILLAAGFTFFYRPGTYYADVIWDLLAALAILPLLATVAVRIEPPTKLRPLLMQLGAASYAIYAIHMPILNLLRLASPRLGLGEFSVISLTSSFVILGAFLFLGIWADLFFDLPIRRVLMSCLVRSQRAPKAARRRRTPEVLLSSSCPTCLMSADGRELERFPVDLNRKDSQVVKNGRVCRH